MNAEFKPTDKKVIRKTIRRDFEDPTHKMPKFKGVPRPPVSFGSLKSILADLANEPEIVEEITESSEAIDTGEESILNLIDRFIAATLSKLKFNLK